MRIDLSKVFIFTVGAAIGSITTWIIMDEKCRMLSLPAGTFVSSGPKPGVSEVSQIFWWHGVSFDYPWTASGCA